MTKVILMVGTEGAGKTYQSKQLIKNVYKSPDINKTALLVFDVNNEWQEYYPFPFDKNMDNFLAKFEKRKNCVGVFEDATSFFSVNGREQKLIELLTERRHTNNTFIFLFHSFQDIPKYILRKATDIFIFKTKDLPGYMESNYKNTIYLPAWQEVQNACKTSAFFSTYPPPPGSVPPSKHLKN